MNRLVWFPILLALAARVVPGPHTVDDAFITFRYAANLASGHGLTYNPGEWVMGSTTPLYTLILAAAYRWLDAVDLAHFSWLFNALLDTAGTALLFRLGRKLTGDSLVGWGAALLWSVTPHSVTFAIGGLETSLVIALLLAAMALHLEGRDGWCGLALGLGVLTRPDVLIAAGLVLGAESVLRFVRAWRMDAHPGQQVAARTAWVAKSLPVRAVLATLAPILPWALYATVIFGSPLPHSIAAKTVAYRLSPEAGLVRILQHYATPFHEHLILGGKWVIVGLVLYGTLYAIGAWAAGRQDRRSVPWFAYPLVYGAVYALANPLLFRWYLSPPVPFGYLGILAGVHALSRAVTRERSRARWALLTMVALFFGALLNAWHLETQPGATRPNPAPEMAFVELERQYLQVALDLRPVLQPGDRLAAADIGVVGWYTDAPVLDLVGLVSPQSTPYYPLPEAAYAINFAVSADLVLAERPDFVVILEVYGRNTLLRDDRFRAQYALWMSYPSGIYGSQGMLVFRRAAS